MSTPATPTPATDWRSVAALAAVINRDSPRQTLSVHAIRHYARNADRNGLAPHVRRLGRKILISESGFFAWLNGQPATGKAA